MPLGRIIAKNTSGEGIMAAHQRRPLAVGNVYRYPGYPNNGFVVTAMSLPGTPTDDGGIPGVAVKWLNPTKEEMWYAVPDEKTFWQNILFANACDPEHAKQEKVADGQN
jgi:hypothetical protein